MGKCVICGNSTGLFSAKTICKRCENIILKSNKDQFMNSDYILNLISIQKNENIKSYIDRCNNIHAAIQINDEYDVDNMTNEDYKISFLNNMVNDKLMNLCNSFLESIENLNDKEKNVEIENFMESLIKLNEETLFYNFALNNAIQILENFVDILNEKNDTNYFFNINKMKPYYSVNGSYLIAKENYKKVIDDINKLNDIINEVNSNLKLSNKNIDINKLNFKCNPYDYIYLCFEPLTKTKKKKKFPFTIFYNITNDGYKYESHGFLYYYDNGELGKAKFRSNDVLYEVSKTNGSLIVKKVTKMDDNKTVLYKL